MGASPDLETALDDDGQIPLRVLFVSSRNRGDFDLSQQDLCTALQASGVETMRIVDNPSGSTLTRFLHQQLRGASARFSTTPVLGESASWLGTLPGRRTSLRDDTTLVTAAPENALPDIAIRFRPNLVIGFAISTTAWTAARDTCDALDIPTAIYLHDENSLRHLMPRRRKRHDSHDLVLADSRSLARSARSFRVDARYVPPLVDLRGAKIDSTLERILYLDPRSQRGLDRVAALAAHFRTIEFVLQETVPLTKREYQHIESLLSQHPNVCFRNIVEPRSEMYRDAAIVIFPGELDSSPRSILESLGNGIPVVASNLPALTESVGPGGLVASSPQEWFDAINRLWQDPEAFRQHGRAGRGHANRAEIQSDQIISKLTSYMSDAVSGRSDRIIDLG